MITRFSLLRPSFFRPGEPSSDGQIEHTDGAHRSTREKKKRTCRIFCSLLPRVTRSRNLHRKKNNKEIFCSFSFLAVRKNNGPCWQVVPVREGRNRLRKKKTLVLIENEFLRSTHKFYSPHIDRCWNSGTHFLLISKDNTKKKNIPGNKFRNIQKGLALFFFLWINNNFLSFWIIGESFPPLLC